MNKAKIVKIGGAAIMIGVLAGGGYFAYNQYRNQQRRTAMAQAITNVPQMEAVMKADVQKIISGSGTVYLKEELSIYSTTEAKVSEVYVEVGDSVTIGQPLVRYDTEDTRENLEKQIAKAELELSNQQLSLQSMTLPATSDTVKSLEKSVDSADKALYDNNATLTNTIAKIEQQEAAIARAEADLDEAKKIIQENEQLLLIGGISQAEYDSALTNKKTAEEKVTDEYTALEELLRQKESNEMNVKTSEKSLQDAEESLQEAGVVLKDESDRIKYQQQQNNIKLSQISLQDLKDQLADIVETANSTLDGTVTQVHVQRGKQVDKESELMALADFTQLIAKSNISEYDAPSLELGMPVTMTSDGLEGITYTGTIIKIGDSASTQSAVSGTETVVPIEVSIENVDGKLKPGFNLDLDILVADKANVLSMAAGAVLIDSETDESYVYVVGEDRRLKKTVVTIGVMGDMTVEVLSGLNENDMVISSPTDAMADGMSMMEIGGVTPTENRQQNGGINGAGGAGIRIGGGGMGGGQPPSGGAMMRPGN